MEEAQHAKLDTLMVEAIAQNLDDASIQQGIDDYFAIGKFLNDGLMVQVQLDIQSLQTATGRSFTQAEKQEISLEYHRACGNLVIDDLNALPRFAHHARLTPRFANANGRFSLYPGWSNPIRASWVYERRISALIGRRLSIFLLSLRRINNVYY